jgi:hypothetical protein
MNRKKTATVAGLVFALAVFAWSVRQVAAKYAFGKLNRNVEICVDLEQARKICRRQGYPLNNYLERARVIGASSLVINEETFDSLRDDGDITYFSAEDIGKIRLLEIVSPYSELSPDIIFFNNPKAVPGYVSALDEKTGQDLKPYTVSGHKALKVTDIETLKKIGWGYDEEKLLLAGGCGFKVIIAPCREGALWLPAGLPANLSCVIYDGMIDAETLNRLQALNVKVPVFEFMTKGMALAGLGRAPYCVVRAHRIESGSLIKPLPLLLDRWESAVRERNCRLLYFDLVENADIEQNLGYLRDLCGMLKKDGYMLEAVDARKLSTNRMKTLPSGLAKIAAFLLAVFVPVFSLGYLWKALKKPGMTPLKVTLLQFLAVSGASLCAGIFINLLLSNYQFYVKLQEFFNIKLAFILPVFMLVFVLYERKDLTELWHKNIQARDAFICAVILLAVIAAIIRSGNYPLIAAPEFELKLRSLLKDIFVIRPRFKEFMFGHPLLMLGLHTRSRFLIILGVIGQLSIINTFIHVHTPIDISIFRTLYGVLLGAALGLLFIFLYKKLRNGLWAGKKIF